MKIKEKQIRFTLNRFYGFLITFLRNRKGIFGVVIIIGFVAVALLSPFLTPYTPLGEEPLTRRPPAVKFCAPSWYRYLPEWLGGNPKLSENFFIVNDPAVPKLDYEGGEWKFITNKVDRILASHNAEINCPIGDIAGYESKNGSIEIRYIREKGVIPQNCKAYLIKEFFYPYRGPPAELSGNIALLVNGSTFTVKNSEYLDVPVEVKVFIGRVGGKNFTIWPAIGTGEMPYGFPLVSNDNGVDSPDLPPLIERAPLRGKLFKSGMEGIVPGIGIYANGTGNITFAYGIYPFPGMDKVGSVTITLNSSIWDWHWADLDLNWNYSTLFIWIEKIEGEILYGYDDQVPHDAMVLRGGKWSVEYNKRYFIRVSGDPIVSKPAAGLEEVDGWLLSSATIGNPQIGVGGISGQSIVTAMDIDPRENPARVIFTEDPGKYLLGLEITFVDELSPEKDVKTTVYVDDFYLNLFGNSFGLMGTDHQGRDLFSQLIYGTRISLYLGIAVSVMTVVLGLSVGLAAGYLGGIADELLMRFNDLMLCLPGLPLLIVLAAVIGTTIENLMIVMVLIGWNGFARVVRSMALSLKERPFVEAAKSVGAGTGYILWRHILPNVMAIVYVSLATSVPGAVTAEASLSWLGFYDPTRMSWGRMLHNISHLGGAAQAIVNPLWVLAPGLSISLLAVAFILLGYALDDILNPRLRLRR